MKLFYFVLLSILVLFDSGCTREISVQAPEVVKEAGQVAGAIRLPAGIKIDTSGLKVFSAVKSAVPVNSTYAVDTAGKTSTTLLMNENGDVLLMGYNYPGQTESDVSAESTALAFLMNTLTMRSLSVSGRVDAIKKIRATPTYNKLVIAVENSLKSGKAVSDTTNTELIEAVAKAFESTISGLRTSKTEGHKDPIIIKTINTELQLRNNLVAHSYVAGIYKDGVQIKRLTIGGYTFFAQGILEGLEAIFNDGYGIPESAEYSMTEEGEYEVKIRSGRPGSDDGSSEYRSARIENVSKFLLRQIAENLPVPASCVDAAMLALKNRISNTLAAKEVILNSASSPTDYAFLATNIAADVFADTKDILEQCDGISEESFEFFKGMSKLTKFLGKAMGFADIVMKTANIYSHTEDLYKSRAAIDTCFQVVGLRTFPCGEQPAYLVIAIDGDKQKGGAGKELEKPLQVKVTFEDGRPASKTLVNWVISSGGGIVSSATSETNYEGIAEVKWKLGSGGATQKIEAYVNKKTESKSAYFTASVAGTAVHKIEIISKNSTGTFYTNPIKVRVTDVDGNPIPQVEINWLPNIGVTVKTSERFSNIEGIAEATIELIGDKISLKAEVKGDEAKAAMFVPEEFISGISLGGDDSYCFVDINEKRDSLPNPFKIIFVDKHLIPTPGIGFEYGPTNGKIGGKKVGETGEVTFIRNDLSIKQYQVRISFDGKTIGSWSDVIIN